MLCLADCAELTAQICARAICVNCSLCIFLLVVVVVFYVRHSIQGVCVTRGTYTPGLARAATDLVTIYLSMCIS